jgi:hypothetical protein
MRLAAMEILLQRWTTSAEHLQAARVLWQPLTAAAASKLLTKTEQGWYSALASRLLQHITSNIEQMYALYEDSIHTVRVWAAASCMPAIAAAAATALTVTPALQTICALVVSGMPCSRALLLC